MSVESIKISKHVANQSFIAIGTIEVGIPTYGTLVGF